VPGCLQGSSQAGPAGDDVAHEESMLGDGLGLSELNQGSGLSGANIISEFHIESSLGVTLEHFIVHWKVGCTDLPTFY